MGCHAYFIHTRACLYKITEQQYPDVCSAVDLMVFDNYLAFHGTDG